MKIMKKEIDILDYAKHILQVIKKGFLITAKSNDRINTMIGSWGCIGIEWEKPIFIVFIRENRFTRTLIEENPEFTINIPIESIDKKIRKLAGTQSGRDIDKIKELNLTLVEPSVISVPAIKEFPLTIECKVLYKQKQDSKEIPEEFKNTFYPQDVDGYFYGMNRDYHFAYYGEIVSAYIIE